MKYKGTTAAWVRRGTVLMLTAAVCGVIGCGGTKATKKDDFFTSGSREADQRASQRMAKEQQLSGTKEGQENTKATGEGAPAQAEGKQPLFERLGGEQGITAIVEDFTARALADPRVKLVSED